MSLSFWRAVLPGPWPGLIESIQIDGAGNVMSEHHAGALAWMDSRGNPCLPCWCVP